jgi:xanthine/uracil permease
MKKNNNKKLKKKQNKKIKSFDKIKYLFLCIILSIILVYILHIFFSNYCKIIIGTILGYFIYILLIKKYYF